MLEIYKYLKLLRKYRFILIIVPAVSIIITFFLVRNLSNSYVSQAQVASGIVDETQEQSLLFQAVRADQISYRFSNLIELMKMKRILDQVSYQLIIHDLTSSVPFKSKSSLVLTLKPTAIEHALKIYREKYKNTQSLNLNNSDQNGLYSVLKSMKYDSESLKSKLAVFRSGDSDFITVQYESENPDLSAFIANTLAAEFIKDYSQNLKANQAKANSFLRGLLEEKNDTLASKMAELRNYKINNQVLNLTEQSKQLYLLLLQYDTKKQEALEKVSSYAGALNEIDRKFDPNERKYIEAALSKVNQSIIDSKEELSSLYTLYINNDLEEHYKNNYDSLRNVLTEKINKSADQYITDPLNAKQELITQKLNLEIQMDISRYSIASLEQKISSLTGQYNRLVPKEAEVQSLEMSVDIATKEYLEILTKYNQNSLESSFSSKTNLVQFALPGLPQPSKKMLLIILSGVISFTFCLFALFLIYLFDSSITSAQELEIISKNKVLGIVNTLTVPTLDFVKLWEQELKEVELVRFKNQLRAIRYEIERGLNEKVLIITSINPGTGKTLLALSLAYAWRMANKKVLLIDGNFGKPGISGRSPSKVYLEDFLNGKVTLDNSSLNNSLNILSNRGGDVSLLELASQQEINAKLDLARERYDMIIIETGALADTNQAKEWMLFSKDVVAVLESGNKLSGNKKVFLTFLNETNSFMGWILNKVSRK